MKKISIIIFLLITLTLTACGSAPAYSYEYTNGVAAIISGESDEEFNLNESKSNNLKQSGYIINYPTFENLQAIPSEDEDAVYSAITIPLMDYAFDIAQKYENKAKLEYSVDLLDNNTLKVAFTGTGFSSFDDTAEPIEKEFIFDISNASARNLPKIISE